MTRTISPDSETDRVRLVVYVTPQLRDAAGELARREGRTLSGLIRHTLVRMTEGDLEANGSDT